MTFIAHPKILIKRLRRRRVIAAVGSIFRLDSQRLINQLGWFAQLEEIYSDTNQIVPIYKRWFEESSHYANRRIILWEDGTEPELREFSDWYDLILQW